ncbi:hypothetical protein LEMLEM_LOCUS16269 [Lemmus lemmus]
MCRDSSLGSLEVGMTGGLKTESRLHLFLIRDRRPEEVCSDINKAPCEHRESVAVATMGT